MCSVISNQSKAITMPQIDTGSYANQIGSNWTNPIGYYPSRSKRWTHTWLALNSDLRNAILSHGMFVGATNLITDVDYFALQFRLLLHGGQSTQSNDGRRLASLTFAIIILILHTPIMGPNMRFVSVEPATKHMYGHLRKMERGRVMPPTHDSK
jgi:hypothetical protein